MTNQTDKSELFDKNNEVYHFREGYFRDLVGAHVSSLKYLQKITEDFKVLGIGEMKADDLQIIYSRDLESFKKRHQAAIDEDLKRIKNPLIRETITGGSDDLFSDWLRRTDLNIDRFFDLRSGLDSPDHLTVDHFTVKGGEVSFTEENSEALKSEFCTVYVKTETQKKFIALMEETLKGLQELKTILIKNNSGSVFSSLGEIGLFDEGREDIIIASPEIVEFIKN